MNGQLLKQRRTAECLPARLVCLRVGLQPARLSAIARGYVTPREDELDRLNHAIDDLSVARRQVKAIAVEFGKNRHRPRSRRGLRCALESTRFWRRAAPWLAPKSSREKWPD